jgi:hypothetical protein
MRSGDSTGCSRNRSRRCGTAGAALALYAPAEQLDLKIARRRELFEKPTA